jgi:hypothetical protein
MRGKAALVVGLATGYVLGTRDGRARYLQIKTQFNRIISDPRVQETTAQAADLAKAKAPLVKDKLSDVTDKAASKVGSTSGSGSDSASTNGAAASGSGYDTSDSDLPAQTTTSAPDLTHGTGAVSGDTEATSTDTTEGSTSGKDTADEDAILLTPPTPSPLAPGPTDTDSSSSTGGPNG